MTGTAQAPSVTSITQPGWWRDLMEGMRELLRARDLIRQLAVRDVRVRYKEAVMGFAWAVFMPILIILSGLIMRVAISQAMGGPIGREVILGLAVKGMAWGFFAGAISAGTVCLTTNGHLLTRVYFPRAVLPVSAIVSQGFDSGIASIALAVFLPWLGVHVSSALLWVPVLIVLLVALTLGLTLALSCANVMFRDVKHIVQVLLTFGMFFTPVFYEPTMLGAQGLELVMFNPLAPLLEGLRLSLAAGHNLLEPMLVATTKSPALPVWMPGYLGYSAAWAGGALALGAIAFRRTEPRFAELV